MNENFETVLEICSLNEIGYPLTTNQYELTTLQKLFLIHGFNRYTQYKRTQDPNDPNYGKDMKEEHDWDKRTKAEIMRRRKEMGLKT